MLLLAGNYVYGGQSNTTKPKPYLLPYWTIGMRPMSKGSETGKPHRWLSGANQKQTRVDACTMDGAITNGDAADKDTANNEPTRGVQQ